MFFFSILNKRTITLARAARLTYACISHNGILVLSKCDCNFRPLSNRMRDLFNQSGDVNHTIRITLRCLSHFVNRICCPTLNRILYFIKKSAV